ALDRMSHAMQSGDMKSLIESDLEFHLALAAASGNPVLADIARRLLSPLFAFIMIRVLKSGQGPEAWRGDLPRHQWIVQLIAGGNSSLAGQFGQHCMAHFAASAYAVWENAGGSVEAHAQGQPRRKPREKAVT